MIDIEPDEGEEKGDPNEKEEIEDDDHMWNLKKNTIPRGMVELVRMFDKDESTKQRRPPPDERNKNCDSFNLGLEEDPHMVKIGKVCMEQERQEVLKLLFEYKDVIAWSYEDLKTYDQNIIMHDIPLKPNAEPFHQR